jgi:hypothetical protein
MKLANHLSGGAVNNDMYFNLFVIFASIRFADYLPEQFRVVRGQQLFPS